MVDYSKWDNLDSLSSDDDEGGANAAATKVKSTETNSQEDFERDVAATRTAAAALDCPVAP